MNPVFVLLGIMEGSDFLFALMLPDPTRYARLAKEDISPTDPFYAPWHESNGPASCTCPGAAFGS